MKRQGDARPFLVASCVCVPDPPAASPPSFLFFVPTLVPFRRSPSVDLTAEYTENAVCRLLCTCGSVHTFLQSGVPSFLLSTSERQCFLQELCVLAVSILLSLELYSIPLSHSSSLTTDEHWSNGVRTDASALHICRCCRHHRPPLFLTNWQRHTLCVLSLTAACPVSAVVHISRIGRVE